MLGALDQEKYEWHKSISEKVKLCIKLGEAGWALYTNCTNFVAFLNKVQHKN